MSTVGSRIKSLREAAGLTQVELAEKIDVSKQTLYKYENDVVTNIPSDKIELIASVLGVSPAAIMGWVEEPERYYLDSEARQAAQFLFEHPEYRVLYAIQHELCEKDPTKGLIIPGGRENEHGVPFSDEELRVIWKHKDEQIAKIILILCYSGFRVGALKTLEINREDWYFKGGVKTAASKDRIVPIHSAIRGLLCDFPSVKQIREQMRTFMTEIGLPDHTPHDCRHTFSRLCESYGVREADRKRMLGHSFGADITNAVYGHRTLEELREEIEKIKIPKL